MILGEHQPHVFPGCEYLTRMTICDKWIVADDVDFTVGDWQNRNRIKTPFGFQYITVPVEGSGGRTFTRTRLADKQTIQNRAQRGWGLKLWKGLQQSYSRAPHFKDLEWLEPLLVSEPQFLVSGLARPMLETITQYLGITTPVFWATEMVLDGIPTDASEKLAMQSQYLQCDTYAMGRGSYGYIRTAPFDERGIQLRSFQWKAPTYTQRWSKDGFMSNLSVVDLIANVGPEATGILRSAISIGQSVWTDIGGVP